MKKILVIMGAFAPNNTCGSIPNTKLIKNLVRKGDNEITLITTALTPDMSIDETLMPAELASSRIFRVPYSKLYSNSIGMMRAKLTDSGMKLKMKTERRKVRARIVLFLKNMYFRCQTWDWYWNAKKIIRNELSGDHFDVVFSSYPGRQEHLLAAFIRKKHMATKWIADFRDPMGYAEYDASIYRRAMRQQHRIEKKADLVTVVSNGAMEKFRFPDIPEEKLVYLPNGYDPEDYDFSPDEQIESTEKLRFFYAGSLYAGKRNLTVLFRAIRELASEGVLDTNDLSVEYAGNEWPVLLSYANPFGLEGICSDYGYITRSRVIELMHKMDITIVCSHNTSVDNGVVTGKVFELLLVEKPILSVITGNLPNSELGMIVKDCNAGFVYEEANHDIDYLLLKKWLLRVYKEKKETGAVRSDINREKREKYSYVHISQRLHDLFDVVPSG